MKKKRAKFNFILTSILVVLALVLCFAQFELPFSNQKYNSMFSAISTTADINSGNTAIYQITTEEVEDAEVEDTLNQIRNILSEQGFVGSKVYRVGDYIKAEVESNSNSASVLSIIGDTKSFYITDVDQETITEEELTDYSITGEYVKTAESTRQYDGIGTEYNGITITFTEDGAKKLEELTKQVSASSNKNIYFYINGNKSSSLPIEEVNKTNQLSFYSEGYTSDIAKQYAVQIKMASTGVVLKTISNNTTTPTMGSNVLLFTMIAFAAALLAVMIALPILYGDFGFVADLSIICGVIFNIFLLSALPVTTGSIATIFGSMVGMAILVVCHVIFLNKIKSEYAYLNRLTLAVKTGFKKSWLVNLDLCAVAFIAGLSLAFWNISFISTFAIGLAVGAFVALFNTVVLFKDFITWYVCINSKNYKRVKFTKGEINE